MKSTVLDNDLRDVLAATEIDGIHVRLVGQLDRKQYERVNKVLEALGGTWSRSAKAHVFPSPDHAAAVADAAATGQFIHPKLNGYFPTPPDLARLLVEMAGIEPGEEVLEPSAGRGALALVAAETVGIDGVKCYELLPDNRAELERLGFAVLGDDFLWSTPATGAMGYDRVVMNPPFQRRAYVLHILHAWAHLRPGGVLAAIAPTSITSATEKASRELQDLMDRHGAVIVPNPDDAFSAAGTNVRTVRFAMTKPAAPEPAR